VDGPASRRKFVLGIVFLGASRWPPQIVIRYAAGAARMTKPQYIEALVAVPWRFPAADGIDEVPPDWASAAWDVKAVRTPILDELRSSVSKLGELCLEDNQLRKMSAVLRTDQVVSLYESLTNDSPHRESEFRNEFVTAFSQHASHLPAELTREQIIERLGVDEATAAMLLGEE